MSMMELDVKRFGDPVLKSRSTPVKEFDESLERLASDMLSTMRAHEGVGLAANQVGRLKRILVATFEEDDYVLVNPIVESRTEETEMAPEGCLSIPGVHVEVERAKGVAVSGMDAKGEPVRMEVEGLLARILQHEIDHLDGVLILDRTDRESRKAVMREMRENMLARG